MDGRGGCCIARYAGNIYDMSKIDRIMLRYRPIAPKPATNSSGSGSSTAENGSARVKTGRGKRRYVRNGCKKVGSVSNGGGGGASKRCKCKSGGGGGRKRKSSSPEENESNGRSTVSTVSVSGGDGFVTLPLLPETPETKQEGSSSHESPARATSKAPLWLNFGGGGGGWGCQQDYGTAGVVAQQQQQPVRVVETWVKVECVSITEAWAGTSYGYGGLVGCTDGEKLMNLERDTCPGFISDGCNRVIWVNRAYREMIVGQEEVDQEKEEEVLVWLVTKEGLQMPPKNWAAFTCRVRVVTCGKEKSSLTLPCDVWRLNGGQGFAWRLDTKAALSLTLGL